MRVQERTTRELQEIKRLMRDQRMSEDVDISTVVPLLQSTVI